MDRKLQFSSVEIVTHCYRYSRLLCYQLSSLLLHPPTIPTQITVFTSKCDTDTLKTAEHFIGLGLRVRIWTQKRIHLFRRSMGRNLAARDTEASVLWYTDCDHWFGPGCIDSLAPCVEKDRLFSPSSLFIHRDHQTGDSYIDKLSLGRPRLVDINPDDFVSRRVLKTIGGVQIVNRSTANKHGYLEKWKRGRYQRPSPDTVFQKCKSDSQYRKMLREHGATECPIDIPNLYRLRHSKAGREQVGLSL